MTFKLIKSLCKLGFTGIIPDWKGYLDWNYSTNLIYFYNNGYILNLLELEDKLNKRNDLYYII